MARRSHRNRVKSTVRSRATERTPLFCAPKRTSSAVSQPDCSYSVRVDRRRRWRRPAFRAGFAVGMRKNGPVSVAAQWRSLGGPMTLIDEYDTADDARFRCAGDRELAAVRARQQDRQRMADRLRQDAGTAAGHEHQPHVGMGGGQPRGRLPDRHRQPVGHIHRDGRVPGHAHRSHGAVRSHLMMTRFSPRVRTERRGGEGEEKKNSTAKKRRKRPILCVSSPPVWRRTPIFTRFRFPGSPRNRLLRSIKKKNDEPEDELRVFFSFSFFFSNDRHTVTAYNIIVPNTSARGAEFREFTTPSF